MIIRIEIISDVPTCSSIKRIELAIPNTGISKDIGATTDMGYFLNNEFHPQYAKCVARYT
jgi:hypothetical protein